MSKILRAMTADGSAQILVINSTDMVRDGAAIHNCRLTPAVALGRVMTAAAMMGSTLKDPGNTVTVNVRGDGPCGHILAVADYKGNVKATVQNPGADIPQKRSKVNIRTAIGKGTLNIVKDTGEKEPYIGIVELQSGEIAEDITHYYAESEQIPSVCALGEVINEGRITAAGGMLIMLLPMADDITVSKIEENIGKMPNISAMLAEGRTNDQIASAALDGIEFDVFDEYEIAYACDCSRERMGNALLTLNPVELYNILVEDGQIEVGCQFCNKKFSFNGEDIEKIRKAKKK